MSDFEGSVRVHLILKCLKNHKDLDFNLLKRRLIVEWIFSIPFVKKVDICPILKEGQESVVIIVASGVS